MHKMPKVTILMAIYKPDIRWLIEQLHSLNCQSYKNLELLIWNDAPDDCVDYSAIFKKNITNFYFRIYRGEENFGTNRVFERLTKLAESDFIAYCDQDDIWLNEKISTLVKVAQKNNADLVCSDMYIIDKYNYVIADSISKVRPRQRIHQTDILKYLLRTNFVTGCTILVKTKLAKKAIPFPEEIVYDWWLGIYATLSGIVSVVNKPLIKYRLHDNNQTGILKKVYCKNDYYNEYIIKHWHLMNLLSNTFTGLDDDIFIKQYEIALARKEYSENPSFYTFTKLAKFLSINEFSLKLILDMILPLMTEKQFSFLLKYLKKRQKKI